MKKAKLNQELFWIVKNMVGNKKIEIKTKLFLVECPFQFNCALTKIQSLFPSENEIFEGQYHYKFIVVPYNGNNFKITDISKIKEINPDAILGLGATDYFKNINKNENMAH